MNLLIVDDQPGVVEGLVHGVSWKDVGFTSVLTALNAIEAKALLKKHTIDVMLCDIEMPMENGLDLVSWIREQNYETRCIFLTAHAKFSYAQEALKLGGFDYIIQPAPYGEIRRVVQRAIDDVKTSAKKDELYTMGKVFREQEPLIRANALRNYLLGNHNEMDFEALEKLGSLPNRNQNGYLILIQILRWQTASDKWKGSLLATAFDNIITELFQDYNQLVVVSHMSENTFSLVLQSLKEGDNLNIDTVVRQMIYLNSVCEQYIKCSIASYVDGALPVKDMVRFWPQLVEMESENVALKTGVYKLEQQKKEPYTFKVHEIKRWCSLLQDGYAKAVEEDAVQLLDKLLAGGQLNASTLRNFYQDFIQMLYHAIDGSENKMNELFHTTEELELYRNGMRSVDQMKQLVHHVAANFTCDKQPVDQKYIVDQVIKYINENLEREIRRDELANYVHLNADYLTRIFKKETGYTLKEYVIIQRMQEARSLLRTTTLPVSIIAAKTGYSNFSHFSFTYRKILGITPQEERQGN